MNPHYILVDLCQGTPEWLEWRQSGIGSSDASTIMGENPYKTPAQLLLEKRNPIRIGRGIVRAGAPISDRSSAMARGTQLEPEARRRYILQTGKNVEPACLQSTAYEWLRASLDGFCASPNVVLEIKCGESAYRRASRSGEVPGYYYGQVQHILAVTGFSALDFYCYWPGCPEVLIEVERDESYIAMMLEKEFAFWQLMCQGR